MSAPIPIPMIPSVLDRPLRDLLSPRELEMIYWISEGKSNKDIAVILGTSIHNVHQRIHRAMQASGCENRVELAVRYVREQLSLARP